MLLCVCVCVCVCALVRRIRRKLDRTQTFTTSKHLRKPLLKIILFPFGCAGSSLLNRLSRGRGRGCSLVAVPCFSLRWFLVLRSTGSRVRGFSSCSSWAREHRLNSVAHGLSGSMAHRILPDQGWNRCILYH